ncbi:MAG: sulfotransferase [Hyphomicrobiales bacterium]|nr:sulfotransferase [Hyphomicrobiales bacterium]
MGKITGPDFLCVGAQKAGTQWLYDQANLHPDFWMPPIKELHHFDFPEARIKRAKRLLREAEADLEQCNLDRAEDHRRPLDQRDMAFLRKFVALAPVIDLDRYSALFEPKGALISGDITPAYSALDADVIDSIAGRFADLRVVFIARDPVERFWSAYNMAQRNHDPGTDIDSMVRYFNRDKVRKRSMQSDSVTRWRRAIPPDRFALYFFDDLVGDAGAVRRAVLCFLGGDPDKPSGTLGTGFNRKSSLSKAVLTPAVRARLVGLLADEIRICARELGGPAAAWPEKYQLA